MLELYACSAVIIALLFVVAKWNRKRGWVKVRPQPFEFPVLFAAPNPETAHFPMDRLSTKGLLTLSRALGMHAQANVTTPSPSPDTRLTPAAQTSSAAPDSQR